VIASSDDKILIEHQTSLEMFSNDAKKAGLMFSPGDRSN